MDTTGFISFCRNNRALCGVLSLLLFSLGLLFITQIDHGTRHDNLPQALAERALFKPRVKVAVPPPLANSSACEDEPARPMKQAAVPQMPIAKETAVKESVTKEPSKQKLIAPEVTPESPTGARSVVEPGSNGRSVVAVLKERATPEEGGGDAVVQKKAPVESPRKPVAAPLPPLNVTLDYSLLRGVDGFTLGKVRHTWKISDGRYALSAVAKATGLLSLLNLGEYVQSSEGVITPDKVLKPEIYREQRGQEAKHNYIAQFDYAHNTLTYGRVSKTSTVELPPGTQDQLSFAYQLALNAPFSSNPIRLSVVGKKLGRYTLNVVGEESIDTEMGRLRTLHLSRVRERKKDEGVDIWLALDHHYLPVKVRFTDRKGGVLEQVVRAIEGEQP